VADIEYEEALVNLNLGGKQEENCGLAGPDDTVQIVSLRAGSGPFCGMTTTEEMRSRMVEHSPGCTNGVMRAVEGAVEDEEESGVKSLGDIVRVASVVI